MIGRRAKLGALGGDLQSDCALAGDHPYILERPDQFRVALGGDGAADLLAAFVIAVIGHHFRAIGLCALDLQRRCILGHHNDGVHAATAGGAGHGLRMVAAGIGNHIGNTVRQAHHGIHRAAQLERSRMLQVLAFHQQPEV